KTTNLICIGTSATMSSTGTEEERERVVAAVASTLFGQPIPPQNIIGETLERASNKQLGLQSVRSKLSASLARTEFTWKSAAEFANDPLAVWVELVLGLSISEGNRPKRAQPLSLTTAASRLAEDARVSPAVAKEALARFLIAA